MRKSKTFRNIVTASALFLSFGMVSATAQGNFRPTGAPLTIEAMMKDYNVWGARISPDGKHIAALAGVPGQNPIVRVWDTEDMSKAPLQFGSRVMRFVNLSFIKNDKLFLGTAQPVEQGHNSDWIFSGAIANLDGSKIDAISNENAENTRDEDRVINVTVFNRLPLDPENILVQISKFSGTEIVKVNLRSGASRRYFRSGENESVEWDDNQGVIRVKNRLDFQNGVYYVKYYLREGENNWRELTGLQQAINDRYTLSVQHVSNDNRTIWVITDKDTNYAVLKKFDVATNTFSETFAQNTEFDLTSATFGSAADEYAQNADPLRDFCWGGPSTECQYSDPVDVRINALLERALPGRNITFGVRDGGQRVLVQATAPNVPTTFYLLKNERQLVRIGSMLEGWDNRNLGPAEWVNYPARDGLQIPSVLTLPPGYNKERDGRIPLVVLPHGGPWARDDMDFDSSYWPQMFATRGFAVLQPNYRGSEGLGKVLWKAGDKEWGGKMQDDNDDGARWLVAQGIADPNRMMVYGYSYGGFAAAAAAARSGSASQGLWQCAISGAPAIDLVRISNDWGASRIQRITQGVTVDGWNPAAHLNEVKIPWLIVHGTYDHQADIQHSRDAAATMRSQNPSATFKFIQIPRMSHTLVEMLPEHKQQLMASILDWTANNCGNISATFDDAEATSIARRMNR